MRVPYDRHDYSTLAQKRVMIEFVSYLGLNQPACPMANPLSWVHPHETLIIGRSRDVAQLNVANDRSMSRRHFEVSFDGCRCLLHDLDSSNGTFVNEELITTCEVQNGDEIRAGESIFMISILESSPNDFEHDEWKLATTIESSQPHGEVTGAGVAPEILEDTQPLKVIKKTDDQLIIQDFDESTMLLRPEQGNRPARNGRTIDVNANSLELEEVPAPQVVTIRLLDESHIDRHATFSRVLTWLRPEQKLTVGSSDQRSDWRLPTASSLEPQHFELEHNGEECTIRSLGTDSSVKVNGANVVHSQLHDGDRIEAGNGVFIVEFA